MASLAEVGGSLQDHARGRGRWHLSKRRQVQAMKHWSLASQASASEEGAWAVT